MHNFSTLSGRPGIWLVDLYVNPDARNMGIGSNMLAYLAKLAEKRNCGRLEWSALNSNKSAIAFYKNIGAQAMDDWTTYRVTGDTLYSLAQKG